MQGSIAEVSGRISGVGDDGAECRQQLLFWREFTAGVANFPVGVKPRILRREIEAWSHDVFNS